MKSNFMGGIENFILGLCYNKLLKRSGLGWLFHTKTLLQQYLCILRYLIYGKMHLSSEDNEYKRMYTHLIIR